MQSFNKKSPCVFNEQLNNEIKSFISEVQEIGEESISDYLVWKWRTMETPLKVIPFSRHYESSRSGADIELIFLLDDIYMRKPLVIQAKKIFTDTNKDIASQMIMYGKKKGRTVRGLQKKTLKKYCEEKTKKIPLYMFYSNPTTEVIIENPKCPSNECGWQSDVNELGVFVSRLPSVEKLIKVSGKTKSNHDKYEKITLEDLLKNSFPMHKIFCRDNKLRDDEDSESSGRSNPKQPPHPNNNPSQNFKKFLKEFNEKVKIPDYVKELIEGNNSVESIAKNYFGDGIMPKWIAIYDLSDKYTNDNYKNDVVKNHIAKDLPVESFNATEHSFGMGWRKTKAKQRQDKYKVLIPSE
jgi:hypothetical protein